MNKKILILLLSGILLCLGGCGNNELENRSFPLAVGMETADEESRMVFNFPVLSEIANENADGSYMSTASMTGKDFFSIENNYAKSDSKTIDFSHCKALVIGENFFEDEKKMDALVSYLQNQNRVARNTYLFITKLPMEELFAMDENLEKPLGTYLEELLESDESLKNKQIMTLGKYMDERKNRKEIIYIPVIGNQNDSPAVTGAYVVRYGKALGETDTRMALASAFVEGKLEKGFYEDTKGNQWELKQIKSIYEIQKREEEIDITVTVSLEAALKNGRIQDVWEQEKKEAELKKELEAALAQAEKKAKKQGYDFTNSYKKTGNHAREIYRVYQEQYDAYEKDSRITVVVEPAVTN